jgi:hypothetical protein
MIFSEGRSHIAGTGKESLACNPPWGRSYVTHAPQLFCCSEVSRPICGNRLFSSTITVNWEAWSIGSIWQRVKFSFNHISCILSFWHAGMQCLSSSW